MSPKMENNQYQNLSVLLTGADGLLGRQVISILRSGGCQVHAIVRNRPNMPISGVRYLELDLSKAISLDDLPQQIDVIFHFAQSSSFRSFPEGAMDVFKVNIDSTARLLDYGCKAGIKKFIYTSSGGIYGYSSTPFIENSPIIPPGRLGFYLGSKACGEILVQSYTEQFQVVILRPFFMYGPYQNRDMLIPRIFDNIRSGNSITLQGDKGISINPVHVYDAAHALTATLNLTESATFNVAGPEVLSLRKICNIMGQYLGLVPNYEFENKVPNDLVGDISAMSKMLIEPKRTLASSLDDISN